MKQRNVAGWSRLRSRRGTVVALLGVSALAAGLLTAPADAASRTTTGTATVNQTANAGTPGFNTTCTVSSKTQNCAEVHAFAPSGNLMFVGGAFAQILDGSGNVVKDPATGLQLAANNLAVLDTSNGDAVLTTFKHTFNGTILALAVSPDGTRLYVGGEFTKIDGKLAGHLAAFDITSAHFGAQLKVFKVGTALTANPLVKNALHAPRGRVRSLLVGPSLNGGTGGTLYVGGDFVSALGVTVQQLFAMDIATGALIPTFTPNIAVGTTLPSCGNLATVVSDANNSTQIWSLALGQDAVGNSRLYVSGHFDSVDGNAQTALAALDPATGRWVSTFKPMLAYEQSVGTGAATTACYDILHTVNQVTPVDTAGGTRTAGVLVAQAGHWNRAYRLALDGSRPLNGAIGNGWIAQPGGDAQSVVIVNKTVYIGGHFICWSTDPTKGLGRSDCLAGMATTAVPPSYEIQRVHLAAVNYDTGATDMSWAPLAQPSTYSPYYFGVWTLLVDSANNLWAGGVFRTINTPDGQSASHAKLAIFPVQSAATPTTGTMTPTACKAATVCTFTAWVDPAPGSNASSFTYTWDFGDGTTTGPVSGTVTATSVSATVTHTYPATTTTVPYQVTVTINDGTTPAPVVKANVNAVP